MLQTVFLVVIALVCTLVLARLRPSNVSLSTLTACFSAIPVLLLAAAHGPATLIKIITTVV